MADNRDPKYGIEWPEGEWRASPDCPASIHVDEQGWISMCWEEEIQGQPARVCKDIDLYLAARLLEMLSRGIAALTLRAQRGGTVPGLNMTGVAEVMRLGLEMMKEEDARRFPESSPHGMS